MAPAVTCLVLVQPAGLAAKAGLTTAAGVTVAQAGRAFLGVREIVGPALGFFTGLLAVEAALRALVETQEFLVMRAPAGSGALVPAQPYGVRLSISVAVAAVVVRRGLTAITADSAGVGARLLPAHAIRE